MNRNGDMRFYGLYNLVEVKETSRIGMYIGSVLASFERGGAGVPIFEAALEAL